jgi:hypothetical protein
MRTSSLFDKSLLKPRMEIVHECPLLLATSTPGAIRSACGMLLAPERRMSARVITNTAAGASMAASSRRETEVTRTRPSSSMLSSSKAIARCSTASVVAARCADASVTAAVRKAAAQSTE